MNLNGFDLGGWWLVAGGWWLVKHKLNSPFCQVVYNFIVLFL
jgi:hypothetical protein